MISRFVAFPPLEIAEDSISITPSICELAIPKVVHQRAPFGIHCMTAFGDGVNLATMSLHQHFNRQGFQISILANCLAFPEGILPGKEREFTFLFHGGCIPRYRNVDVHNAIMKIMATNHQMRRKSLGVIAEFLCVKWEVLNSCRSCSKSLTIVDMFMCRLGCRCRRRPKSQDNCQNNVLVPM